jgi:hypothetical protein
MGECLQSPPPLPPLPSLLPEYPNASPRFRW